MKVYIGFACPSKGFVPFAALIKKVESRPYDHCYVRFQEPMGEWMIFQASGSFVNMFNLGVWLASNRPIKEYEIEVTPEQAAALWDFIKKNLGIPYSLKEDFGILLMKLSSLIKSNPFSAGMAAEFCSKLAANVCKLLGIRVPDSSDDIDPTRLDSILGALGLPCTLNPQLAAT